MHLLPETKPEFVHEGWWWNFIAPLYRQCLGTMTNVQALLFLGILASLGTIAGDKL
jgi:hypothetical protein